MVAAIWKSTQDIYDILIKHLGAYDKRILLQKKWWNIFMRWINENVSDKMWVDWIIEYTNKAPVPYQPPQLDNSFTFVNNILNSTLQNSFWIHSTTLWEIEWRSWLQMAQAQQYDKQNIIDIVQNYKEWLIWLSKIILYLYSEKLNTDLLLEYKDFQLSIIWKKEYDFLSNNWIDVSWILPITYFDKLNIEIVPWDYMSQTYITNKLIELKWMWLPIPDEALLESIKTWDIWLLIRKYEIKKEKEKQKSPDQTIAEWENWKILSWWQIEVSPTNNHEIHIITHKNLLKQYKEQIIQKVTWWKQNLSKQEQDMVDNMMKNDKIIWQIIQHIKDHEMMMNSKQNNQDVNNLLNNIK